MKWVTFVALPIIGTFSLTSPSLLFSHTIKSPVQKQWDWYVSMFEGGREGGGGRGEGRGGEGRGGEGRGGEGRGGEIVAS